MNKKLASSLSIGLLLGACASPTVVQSVKPGDTGLNCAQLQNEYADAEKFKKEAEGEKGVTGGNVARVLFWPAIIGTYMNANEAIAAAENRKVHLSNQMAQKNCPLSGGGAQVVENKPAETTQPAVQNASTATTGKEAKLAELKRLFDSNLITKEVYVERQKAVLDVQ